jgi:hypothetical protein
MAVASSTVMTNYNEVSARGCGAKFSILFFISFAETQSPRPQWKQFAT